MTKRRTVLKALAAAGATAALPGCSTPPVAPAVSGAGGKERMIAYLREDIAHAMRRANVVGLNIALLDDQHLVWSEAFGYTDPQRKLPVGADSRFRAGSISKLFTTVAAMQLAEAGKLDLDAPLSSVLPGFAMRSHADQDKPVTPRLLMTHHAGLPTDQHEGMWTDRPLPLSGLLAQLREEYTAFPPGQLYAYSNLGFSLLGLAVEQAAGMPYERYMTERVLRPLGMRRASFSSEPPRETMAYDLRGKAEHEYGLRDVPAGGLNTSAEELLQFARMVFAGGMGAGTRVLAGGSLAEMARPQQVGTALDADMQVGLGWHYANGVVDGGGTVLFHAGGTPHHHATLMLLPEHKLAVAVLANSASARQALDDLGRKALALLLEAKSGIVQPKQDTAAPADPRFPPRRPSELVGSYDTDVGVVHIDGDDARLRASVGGFELAMVKRPNGYFALEYKMLGLMSVDLGMLSTLEFTVADIDGHRCLLARRHGRFHRAGTTLAPVAVPPAWSRRLGSYRYAGGDPFLAGMIEAVELKLERGLLVVEARSKEGPMRLALAPAGDSAAIVRGLGRARGDTLHVRASSDGDMLVYAGMRFKPHSGAKGA